VKAHAMRRHLWAISHVLVPRKDVFDFNQAIMDLGATVCTARKPKCTACPMMKICTYFPMVSANVQR
jgi:A/G-specific adenine glycosylase